jgi:hypothetical protein
MGEKDEYCGQVRAKLEELENEIEIIQDRAEKARPAAKAEFEELFDMLCAKHDNVLDLVRQLEEAEGESWWDMQPAVDGALSELQHSTANVLFRMA